MLILNIHDTAGTTLHVGDWVKLTNSFGRMNFFVQVEVLEDGRISPFDNFAFDSATKIEPTEIPSSAHKTRYGYVLHNIDINENYSEEQMNAYMLNLRQLDHNRSKYYTITKPC